MKSDNPPPPNVYEIISQEFFFCCNKICLSIFHLLNFPLAQIPTCSNSHLLNFPLAQLPTLLNFQLAQLPTLLNFPPCSTSILLNFPLAQLPTLLNFHLLNIPVSGGSKEHGNTLVFPKPHFKNVPWKKIDKKEIFQSITVILEHQERDGS